MEGGVSFLKCWLSHCCLVTKSGTTAYSPMDCSPPGSSVHGISQARILEWVAISFSRGSLRSRDQTRVPALHCIASGFFTTEPPRMSWLLCWVVAFIFIKQIKKQAA